MNVKYMLILLGPVHLDSTYQSLLHDYNFITPLPPPPKCFLHLIQYPLPDYPHFPPPSKCFMKAVLAPPPPVSFTPLNASHAPSRRNP